MVSIIMFGLGQILVIIGVNTVEPPNKGHVGTKGFVLYTEVSFIRRS